MMIDEPQVDALSPDVAEMARHWPMIDALVGGTHAMRHAGARFLPKWPKEDQDNYNARLATATLFPAFSHTASVMAAKPFARPMKIAGDIPAPVEELLENVDLAGSDFAPWCAALMLRVMQHGLTGVLVDYPRVDGLRTRADELAAGVRPYFATYAATSILGWRVENGQLTQLRLMESVLVDDGPWNQKRVSQVRVLYPGSWEVWRKNEDGPRAGKWDLFDAGVTSIQRIPFVFFYGVRRGFGIADPPLLELAHLNVEHWQSASDQQAILHVARVPILFAKGFTDADNLVVGAGAAVRALSDQAELKFVEHSGAAIEAGRQSLLDLEDRMRQSGAELLVQRPAVATATQVRAESESNRSILQQMAEDFEESAEQLIVLLGEWIGLPADAEIELFKDFGADDLSDSAGDLLLRAEAQGVVSRETAFKQLQRMDVVAPDLDWQDEETRLTDSRRAADAREQKQI